LREAKLAFQHGRAARQFDRVDLIRPGWRHGPRIIVI
jgi:hypothetical protein